MLAPRMPAPADVFNAIIVRVWRLLMLLWGVVKAPFCMTQWRHRHLFKAGTVKPAVAKAFLAKDALSQPLLIARRARGIQRLLQSCIDLQQAATAISEAREASARGAASMERLAISAEKATAMLPARHCLFECRGAAPARPPQEPRAAERTTFKALLMVAQRMRLTASSHRQLVADLAAAEARNKDALEAALVKATLDLTRYLEDREQH